MATRFTIFFICLFSFIFLLQGKAQRVVSLTEGLMVGPCNQYGREGIYTDQLAYRLYKGLIKTPVAGQLLFTDEKGQPISFERITADTSAHFRSKSFAGRYLYLSYTSSKEEVRLFKSTGSSMFYLNGDPHASDVYSSNWLYIPVKLKKGLNEFYLRTSWLSEDGVNALLITPEKQVMLNSEDLTIPMIESGKVNGELWGGIVIVNATDKLLTNLEIKTTLEGREVKLSVPNVLALSTRKVGFRFNALGVKDKGQYNCTVTLLQKGKLLDEKTIKIESVTSKDYYSNTFISDIDGSVQYYSVCPQSSDETKPPALFLSVHGAGVEAIGQARAYKSKDWGVLVTPTNRRPRGFNWEDWGRIDALEVLNIATKKFNPDPQRIYLTGHSMGGHGTWYLGATFPGKWAAIAPCAAYPTLTGYGSADGQIPASGRSSTENTLLRASNGSNVVELAKNYNAAGIYILHGDSDEVVSVNYARSMRKTLSDFHKDFCYYEYPGGGHWFGSQSVDWQPIFDYFKWHTIRPDSVVNSIDFSTANTAVSSSYYWASVLQQQEALKYSRIRLIRDKKHGKITGETENVSILGLSLAAFGAGETVSLDIDHQSIKYVIPSTNAMIYLYHKNQWEIGNQPDGNQKGTARNGTFKEPFNYRMVFVYGTTGNEQENHWALAKARYDAETWYYRANGAIDIVADKDFNPADYPDRGLIIYGNATTNSAWKKVLSKCPIQVERGNITLNSQKITGDDLGAYIMWPRPDSKKASVAAITGTGIIGFNAASANQYFAGGSGFPDYMIFSVDMLKEGSKGIKYAGFYTNDWKISE